METEYDGYVSDHGAIGIDIEDNEIEKVNIDGYSHHVDLTETELSQDIFYESVKILMKTSEKPRERRQSIRKQKRKRSRTEYQQPNEAKAYSRCSLPYLFTVIKKVLTCPHYVDLLKNIGFAFMLDVDDCYIPRQFAQWVADHVDIVEEVIRIGSKDIQLNLQSIKDTLGINYGTSRVATDEESGKVAFLALYGLEDVPSIKFFGDRILNGPLEDDDFCRCFVSVSLGCFLCPNFISS